MQLYCQYLYQLYTATHCFNDYVTFLPGRMSMLLQFSKRQTNPCHQTTGRYYFLVNSSKYHIHLYNYIPENNLLMNLFKVTTRFQLRVLDTYHSFHEAIVSGKELQVVFCDINKAFDSLRQRAIAQIDWHGTKLGRIRLGKRFCRRSTRLYP